MSWPKKRKGGKCEFGHENQLWTQKTGKVACAGCIPPFAAYGALRQSRMTHAVFGSCAGAAQILGVLLTEVGGVVTSKRLKALVGRPSEEPDYNSYALMTLEQAELVAKNLPNASAYITYVVGIRRLPDASWEADEIT